MKCIFLLIFYLKMCLSYKILCLLPYSGKSHQLIFEPILEEMIRRGHLLTVVSFFPSLQKHPNRRDISLVGLAPISLEVVNLTESVPSFFGLEKYYESVPLAIELAKINLNLCEKLLNDLVFDEFVEGKGDYDVVIVEHFNSDCMLSVVHKYGVPSVGLMSSTLLPWTMRRFGAGDNPSYTPGMMVPFTEEMTFAERIVNTLSQICWNLWYDIAIRRKEQQIVEKRFGKKFPPLEDVAKNTSVVLVNTYHLLNGVRVTPPVIQEVGGIHLHNRTVEPLPEDLEKWVSEANNGVILFSFGSLIKGSTVPKDKLKIIIDVFGKLQQRIIWKWEEGDINNLPKNIRLVRWVPQYDLLNHEKCVGFITHAGISSVMEAVKAGVPILAVPVLGDQFYNAEHARRAGIARVLRLRDFTEQKLTLALRDILSLEIRERTSKFSEMWQHRPLSPIDTAMYYIEKTARFGNLRMSSHARHMSFVQLTLIDVAAFALFTILTIFVTSLYILRLFFLKSSPKLKRS